MPFDAHTAQDIAEFAAYICTDDGAAVARAVADHCGETDAALHGGGLSGAARICAGTRTAKMILTEIGNISVEMACECVAEIASTGACVVVLGAQTDLATCRALRKSGAAEYFTFPVTADEILTAQPAVAAPVFAPPVPAAKSPSIAAMGCNGGVGTSLLAQNLAFHAAAPKGANLRTALLDADLLFGTQAIDLDRDGTAGLLDALTAPERLDETFIRATMDHVTDQLSLYSHQLRIGLDPLPYVAGLPQVFAPLRREFDAVITDLPRSAVMQTDSILADLDTLVLVIPAGFAGVNAASRLIERLSAQAPDLRISPVLSQLRRDAGLSIKDVQTTIGRPVIAVLPRSDAALARAQRAARPMIQIQPRSPYAKAVRMIWTAATTPETTKRRSLRKRIFG